jgi:hypothetical protein
VRSASIDLLACACAALRKKRQHPRHGKIVETAKELVVEWSAGIGP